MLGAAAQETTRSARGELRPIDPARDLRTIADLVATAFADEIDERGRVALREMRWMARLSPLVWWWAQADPSFRDVFNGFVWEEPSAKAKGLQIVGNVSLSRAPGHRERWIICNVVVLDEYRRQGIGRQLVETAVAEARQLGADGVLLQVYRDNLPALKMYTGMGFEEVSGETGLRLEAVTSVAFLDAPGYLLRPWKPADGQAVYELARHVTPLAQQWIRPVRAEEYRLDWLSRLVKAISDLVAGRRVYRLTVLKEERLVAMMAVSASFRGEEHSLRLWVHPNHMGQVEAALVSRALHMLAAIPSRPVRVTVDKEHGAALKVLRDYGFKEGRTLLTLRRDFE
jgi:ribosomal protein S18 acetylase RimI-like enzyme